jgi:hypothetical protein
MDWPEAFALAFGQSIPMGLVLGTIRARTKNNSFACIVAHALVNSFPAMLQVQIG